MPQTEPRPLRDPADVLLSSLHTLRPTPRLSLSEWADAKFVLSSESSADPGPWKTRAYQRGWMDAVTDPAVQQVSLIKSARLGATKGINAAIGYYVEHKPCSIFVRYLPTRSCGTWQSLQVAVA